MTSQAEALTQHHISRAGFISLCIGMGVKGVHRLGTCVEPGQRRTEQGNIQGGYGT